MMISERLRLQVQCFWKKRHGVARDAAEYAVLQMSDDDWKIWEFRLTRTRSGSSGGIHTRQTEAFKNDLNCIDWHMRHRRITPAKRVLIYETARALER